MRRLRFALVVATLSLAASTAFYGQEGSPSGPSCVFPESDDVTNPVVVGPDSIAKRVEFIQPKDAPIRILRVDFTGATLTMSGFFRFTHNWSVEVVNVSDRIALGVGPMVWVYSGNAQGAHHAGGHEPSSLAIRLGPGERRMLQGKGTVTEELIRIGDDVHVRVGIAHVKYDTCMWDNYRNLSPRFAPTDSQ